MEGMVLNATFNNISVISWWSVLCFRLCIIYVCQSSNIYIYILKLFRQRDISLFFF